ncbi:CBO0543 family protein [Bacillus sp. T3]|uniref:CBO0543 family protein n=1 Tax=Bacillus sp. T3 TaxID=467262 RepID=UPI0029822021|nr:CBO0543 family protein [Bacillus sp. T3]
MKTIQSKDKIEKVGEFYQDVTKANHDFLKYWMDHTLFHWDFWLSLIVFTILPIIFWIKIRKKNSSNRLLFSGMFVIIVSSWCDFLGVQYGKWYYTGKVLPSIPSYLPWDWVLLPIFVMTLIQIKPNISPIIKGLIFASINTFIGEPLFIWLGFYVLKDWHIFYSFPIYFVIFLLAYRLSKVKNFEPII